MTYTLELEKALEEVKALRRDDQIYSTDLAALKIVCDAARLYLEQLR